MSKQLKDYFHYTKGERRGAIVLVIICIIAFLFPKMYTFLYPPKDIRDVVTVEAVESIAPKKKTAEATTLFPFNPNTASKTIFQELGLSAKAAQMILNYRDKGGSFKTKADFKKIYAITPADYKRLESYIDIPKKTAYTIPKDIPTSYDNVTRSAPPKPVESFPFDPNTVSKEDLERLGLSDKVINTILKFRSRGKFRKASDFNKIFGLSKEDFLRLKPYITIAKEVKPPRANTASDSTKFVKSAPPKLLININQAAAEEWQLLSGIGPTYAKRIVEFRDNLGGFHSIEQVAEVYGLADSTFQKISPKLQLEDPSVQKININKATTNDLSSHPYLVWKQAQIIINYRENHGAYKNLDDLQEIRAFDAEFIAKIKPYLEL